MRQRCYTPVVFRLECRTAWPLRFERTVLILLTVLAFIFPLVTHSTPIANTVCVTSIVTNSSGFVSHAQVDFTVSKIPTGSNSTNQALPDVVLSNSSSNLSLAFSIRFPTTTLQDRTPPSVSVSIKDIIGLALQIVGLCSLMIAFIQLSNHFSEVRKQGHRQRISDLRAQFDAFANSLEEGPYYGRKCIEEWYHFLNSGFKEKIKDKKDLPPDRLEVCCKEAYEDMLKWHQHRVCAFQSHMLGILNSIRLLAEDSFWVHSPQNIVSFFNRTKRREFVDLAREMHIALFLSLSAYEKILLFLYLRVMLCQEKNICPLSGLSSKLPIQKLVSLLELAETPDKSAECESKLATLVEELAP